MKLFCLLFALTSYFLLSVCQLSGQSEFACREPTQVTEMYRILRANAIESSAISQEDSNMGNDQPHGTIITMNDTCHGSHRNSRLCDCPVRYALNFDAARIPKTLVHTLCCRKDSESLSYWTTRCREVYHGVRVLRRSGCIEGVFQYTLQWERVPVGCSCHVIPNVFSAQ